MAKGQNEETLFWTQLSAFANLAESALASGASLDDAEELLFGWNLPGNLPSCYACLAGGVASARVRS